MESSSDSPKISLYLSEFSSVWLFVRFWQLKDNIILTVSWEYGVSEGLESCKDAKEDPDVRLGAGSNADVRRSRSMLRQSLIPRCPIPRA